VRVETIVPNAFSRKWVLPVAVAAVLLSIAGCGVDVRSDGGSGKRDVEIRTPVGAMSVHTNVDSTATGLPVYPGARPVDDDDSSSADVSLGNGLFGVKVVAAKFESDDRPDAIVDFYRREMATYGDVTVCRGHVDFGHGIASRNVVCRERPASREIQLVVGTHSRHRIVGVKPEGQGSRFAVVYLQTGH
jgi:hypothetical protein